MGIGPEAGGLSLSLLGVPLQPPVSSLGLETVISHPALSLCSFFGGFSASETASATVG